MNNFPTNAAGASPADAPSDDVLSVRQKEYAFIEPSGAYDGIQTGDVVTCTGLVAIHPDFVFMMHVDVPWYHCGTMSAALNELRDRCGPESLKKVELYDVAGITPAVTGVACVVLTWSASYLWAGFPSLAVAMTLLPLFFLGVRARLYWTLWRHGFSWPTMLTRRDAVNRNGQGGFGVNVLVRTSGPNAFRPVLTLPTGDERDERFLVAPAEPKARWFWPRLRQKARLFNAWGTWRLTRSPRSLSRGT